MINFEALFKISYGLYTVSSGSKEYGNGFVSHTFFQVSSDPPMFAARKSIESGKPVRIGELTDLEPRARRI
jgi:flavin reductase (DIM6/NTAB) family NADH-FMN oxidoreductase RutF